MKSFGKLLDRQIRKSGLTEEQVEKLAPFLETISQSYSHFEADRDLMNRSIDLSSRELNEKNNRLEQKTEMLDRFIYRITHDLKSPVNNIIALSTMLIKIASDKDAMATNISKKIQDSARNLSERIGELLEVARTEQVTEPTPENCVISEIVTSIQRDLSEDFNRLSANIKVETEQADTIHFPKRNLESVIQNLISNALKYSKPNVPPKIHLSSQQIESGILLRIKDNGLGMDLEKVGAKLFGLFNRFHSHVEGTGVGLYLVKKMVEENGGNLELDSTPEIGTEFRLFLKSYNN